MKFYVTVLMAKLTPTGVQQAIRQYYRFFLNAVYNKMAKALKQTVREIAVIPCGDIQGCTDLRQN